MLDKKRGKPKLQEYFNITYFVIKPDFWTINGWKAMLAMQRVQKPLICQIGSSDKLWLDVDYWQIKHLETHDVFCLAVLKHERNHFLLETTVSELEMSFSPLEESLSSRANILFFKFNYKKSFRRVIK